MLCFWSSVEFAFLFSFYFLPFLSSFLSFIIVIFKPILFFLHVFLCLPFLVFFSHCSQSLMYINLLHLPLSNFACLFFLSFPLNIFVTLVFIALFPTWYIALVFFSSLCFSQFCSQLVNISFDILCLPGQFTVLYRFDCFDFAHGCILHYFNYYLPDFVTAICLGLIFSFSFWGMF